MRRIIKKERVRVDEDPVPAAEIPRRTGAESGGEVSVEVVRVGGRVEALEIRCACGEVSVIQLTYGDEASPEESNP